MPDSPAPSPSPNPSPSLSPGSGTPPSRENAAHLREITKAEQIAYVAKKAEYAAAMTAREITTARLDAQFVLCGQARTLATSAVNNTVGKEGTTLSEAQSKTALIARLKEIQKAAKQKFRSTNRNRLQSYFVGERFSQNRARLEQDAATLIANATADALPGITPAKLTAAQQALQAYKDSNVTQTTAQGDASGSRVDLATLVRQIKDERIAVQLAADAEWPHTTPANIPIRVEFQLPTRSAFNV